MTIFQPLVLIPVFNHPGTVGKVVDALRRLGLTVLLVDDGSDAETVGVLDSLQNMADVSLLRLPENRGKGGAVSAGLEWASRNGFTHALQVDADGQHELDDAARMLELARQSPDCLISGRPIYDDSVPRSRLLGRYATHAWVWVETLSMSIPDSMCGYRVYPVDASLDVIREEGVGQRMDFDTEIMVRLYWRGIDSIFLPTRVRYPADGVSHFRLWADNWRISCMHTRLVFGMLRRLPRLLLGRKKYSSWSRVGERGSLLGMRLVAGVSKVFGRRGARALLYPIAAYFVLFNPRARRASRQYLTRVHEYVAPEWRTQTRPVIRNIFRHFLNFSREALLKLQVWQGEDELPEVAINGRESLDACRKDGKGALLITAHLGNMEVSRALATLDPALKVNALVYTQNARKFSRLMEEFAPESKQHLILVENIGSDTIIHLRSLIENGEIVVIVGDRTPASENGRVVMAEFLGQAAPFAIGPYLLAHLLECPVGLFFCVPATNGYTLSLEPFADRIHLPRKQRDAAISKHAQAFADRLEFHTLQSPLHWFNFFDFWQETVLPHERKTEVHHGNS